jgi:putative Holliday junction resolvase
VTNSPRTILAFDYGTKRIGIAVGQELTKTATALTTLTCSANKVDWDTIDQLIKEWQPQAVVVGLPLDADGAETDISRGAKRFGDKLQKRYHLETYWMDERLTSVEAERIIAASHKGKKPRANGSYKAGKYKVDKGAVDQLAAKLILESWFNQ